MSRSRQRMISLLVDCLLSNHCNGTTADDDNATATDFSIVFWPILGGNNDTAVAGQVLEPSEAPPCVAIPNDRVKDTFLVAIKASMMTIIMLGAILGNLLVVVSVLRFERLRLLANAFIVSLAFTDLLVACLVMPFSASKELADRWTHGQVMCDLFNANDVLFSTASLLHLCCISVDRYIAVTDPLRYEERLTRRRVAAMLGVVWVASTVISHLPIHTGWYTTAAQLCIIRSPQGDTQCNFEVNQYYGIISSTVSFWVPAIIMVFTYRKIYDEATKQEKYIQSMTTLSSRETSTDRIQYQCVDEAVQRTPPKEAFLGRRVDTYRSLAPSLEGNLDCGSVGRNDVERKLNAGGSVDRNVGRNSVGERRLELSPNRNPIRNSVAGSLDQILDHRDLNRTLDRRRTSCDVRADRNPDRTSFDHQLNRNRSLDLGGLDRNICPSLDRISLDRRLYRNLVQTSCDRQLDRNNACQHRRKMRREHKAAKTLGVIMGAFLFCWLPFFTMYLTNALCGEACHVPHAVESTLFWVGYFNSALNPVIYALLNRDFRHAFRCLLSCRRRLGPPTEAAAVATADGRKTVTASQDHISMR